MRLCNHFGHSVCRFCTFDVGRGVLLTDKGDAEDEVEVILVCRHNRPAKTRRFSRQQLANLETKIS